MKYLSLIGFLLLVGCEKHKSITSVISAATGSTTTAASHKTILVMGQSNGFYMDPSSYKGWNEARGANDTFYNCAEKGTLIAQWDPLGYRWANCLNMVQGVHIDLIIWYQGESDANPEIGGVASDYAYQLTKLFGVWRKQLGDVPIVFAQIANVDIVKLPAFVNWQEVKDQQASIHYPSAVMVRTDDYLGPGNPLNHDGIHFDEPGYRELGKRFANAYMNMGLN